MTYSFNIICLNICRRTAASRIIHDSCHSFPGPGGMVGELPIDLAPGLLHGLVWWYDDTLGTSEGNVNHKTLVGIDSRQVRHAKEVVSRRRRAHVPQIIPRVRNPPDIIAEMIVALVNIQRTLRRDRIRCGYFVLGADLMGHERSVWNAKAYREAVVRGTNVKFPVGLGSGRDCASVGNCGYGLARGTSASVRHCAYLVRLRTVSVTGVAVKLCLENIRAQLMRSKKLSTMACNAWSPG